MLKTFRHIVQAAAIAMPLALGVVPAAAQDIVVNATPSFRDLEYNYNGAGRIQTARDVFESQIPAGTPITDARATLRKAGAHCPPVAGSGDLRCTYSGFATREDHLQEVNWRVDVRSQHGLTTNLKVDRTTLGS